MLVRTRSKAGRNQGNYPEHVRVSSPVSPAVPRARLRGGASHEAKGRRGARGGGAGRVGPPATRRRLGVLRQILHELVAGLEQFLLVDDVVAVEDGAGLVAGQEHGDPLGHAGADQVAGGGAAAIVEEAGRHAGRLAGGAPGRAPAADGDAVAVEDQRAVGVAACPPRASASAMGCEMGSIRPTNVFVAGHPRPRLLLRLARRQRLQRAYHRPAYAEARRAITTLHAELDERNPSAAGSLAEGLDETLTLHRLGLFGVLGRSLKTTNSLESVNALVEDRCAKVDHWQNSSQRQRWLATALLDIEPRLRKVAGYCHLPKLRAEIKRELKIDTTTANKEGA